MSFSSATVRIEQEKILEYPFLKGPNSWKSPSQKEGLYLFWEM
jgi:hypothetical protein